MWPRQPWRQRLLLCSLSVLIACLLGCRSGRLVDKPIKSIYIGTQSGCWLVWPSYFWLLYVSVLTKMWTSLLTSAFFTLVLPLRSAPRLPVTQTLGRTFLLYASSESPKDALYRFGRRESFQNTETDIPVVRNESFAESFSKSIWRVRQSPKY